jgi:hypothetical protein
MPFCNIQHVRIAAVLFVAVTLSNPAAALGEEYHTNALPNYPGQNTFGSASPQSSWPSSEEQVPMMDAAADAEFVKIIKSRHMHFSPYNADNLPVLSSAIRLQRLRQQLADGKGGQNNLRSEWKKDQHEDIDPVNQIAAFKEAARYVASTMIPFEKHNGSVFQF